MSLQYNRDGSVLFISEADRHVTQLEAAGKTQAQIDADYATFEATWPLAYWQAQRQADNFAYLVTTDPEIAKKYDMHEESEYMDAGDDGDSPIRIMRQTTQGD